MTRNHTSPRPWRKMENCSNLRSKDLYIYHDQDPIRPPLNPRAGAPALPAAPRGKGYYALLAPLPEDQALIAGLEAYLRGSGIPKPPARVLHDIGALAGCVALMAEPTYRHLPPTQLECLRMLHRGGVADVRVVVDGRWACPLPGLPEAPFGGVQPPDAGWMPCPLADLLARAHEAIRRIALQSPDPSRHHAQILKLAHCLQAEWGQRQDPDPAIPPHQHARWHAAAQEPIDQLRRAAQALRDPDGGRSALFSALGRVGDILSAAWLANLILQTE